MTTIELADPDGTTELLELTCDLCGLDIDLADLDAEPLDPQRCGPCARGITTADLALAA